MMEYGFWETEVEARFEAGGIRILSFTWQGTRLPVVSSGRSWTNEAGSHHLVMAPGDAVFELCLSPAGDWHILRASPIGRLV